MQKLKLSQKFVTKICKSALKEDLGPAGDITSNLLFSKEIKKFKLIANQKGVLSGISLFKTCFKVLDKTINLKIKKKDGSSFNKGSLIALVIGNPKNILIAERTALNFLSHLSGIATETKKYVNKTKQFKTKICCTRKTLPNLRMIQKYALKNGGGTNHRYNLSDEFLIKDNHIVCDEIKNLIVNAKKSNKNKIITVEVDNLEQLDKIIGMKFDRVLLDNMKPKTLKKALKKINKKYETEASGNINLKNVYSIASTKVDRISIGSLTHSVKAIDFKLEF